MSTKNTPVTLRTWYRQILWDYNLGLHCHIGPPHKRETPTCYESTNYTWKDGTR